MITEKLVFIDCESTGTNIATDRIWQISCLCENSEPLNLYLNPCIPVPKEVCELVGKPNLNKGLADMPTFQDKARDIMAYLNQGTALAGFCILDFDVPLIWEEFRRAGLIWILVDKPILDAAQIFRKKEPRTLEAAVKFYCGREHSGAHDALNDIVATREVLRAMRERYEDLHDMSDRDLARFCNPDDRVDLAGKIVRNKDGVPCYTIGDAKSKGVPCTENPSFGEWMLKRDFPEQTKIVLREILRGNDTKQRELL